MSTEEKDWKPDHIHHHLENKALKLSWQSSAYKEKHCVDSFYLLNKSDQTTSAGHRLRANLTDWLSVFQIEKLIPVDEYINLANFHSESKAEANDNIIWHVTRTTSEDSFICNILEYAKYQVIIVIFK